MSQSCNKTIRNYNLCCAKFEILEIEKAVYYVNSLKGPARDLLFEYCPERMKYQDMFTVRKNDYDSTARKLAVQVDLETLVKLHEKRGIHSLSDGMEMLLTRIKKYFCKPYSLSRIINIKSVV